MNTITITWPPDFRLYLNEQRPGFRAYLQDPDSHLLVGAFSVDPQRAVDAAERELRSRLEMRLAWSPGVPESSRPRLDIKIDLSKLKVNAKPNT